MAQMLDTLLLLVLVLNLFALGSGRMLSLTKIVAIQGVLLSALPLLIHKELSSPVIIAAIAAMALKGILIPNIIIRSLRSVTAKREDEPMLGLVQSIIFGALSTGFVILIANTIVGSGLSENLIIPASISTVLIGFILLITRYKAITQVMGYLVLENGVYIFGMLLVEAVPLVVEMGLLLDLFVGILVISIITNHINQSFSSIDTRSLVLLKE